VPRSGVVASAALFHFTLGAMNRHPPASRWKTRRWFLDAAPVRSCDAERNGTPTFDPRRSRHARSIGSAADDERGRLDVRVAGPRITGDPPGVPVRVRWEPAPERDGRPDGQRAQALPDFSGIWAHANPGFEPLSSGPTSLINRVRRPNGTGDILNLTGDHTNPILKPAAAAAVQKHAEYHAKDQGDPNPRNQCWPEGPPFTFTNGPTRIVQTKDKVAILYQYNHQVRHVRMNAQHPAKVTPSWYGDSVGRYEGERPGLPALLLGIGILNGKLAVLGFLAQLVLLDLACLAHLGLFLGFVFGAEIPPETEKHQHRYSRENDVGFLHKVRGVG